MYCIVLLRKEKKASLMNFSASGSTKKGVLYFSKPFYTVVGSLGLGNLGWTKVTYVVYPHR